MIPHQLLEEHYAFFVPSPEAFFHSNGITVMLDAIQAAIGLGLQIVLVPSHDRCAWYTELPDPYQNIPVRWQVPEQCRAIVSDTILPDLLEEVRVKAKSICHYTLAPWGLFGDCGVFSNLQTIKSGERQAVYSPHVSTQLPFFYLQTQFDSLEAWIPWAQAKKLSRIQKHPNRSLRACIYHGKGYPARLDSEELRNRISRPHSHLITRWDPIRGHPHPSTKGALYQLLANSDLLISFDPISSLAYEATLLGIPSLVKAPWDEQEFSSRLPVRFDGIAWDDELEMIRLIDQGFDHEAVLSSYRQAIDNNIEQLISLLSFATDAHGPELEPDEVNAYWSSRQKFFRSLSLPSSRDTWGGVGKVLMPVQAADYIADFLDWLSARVLWLRYAIRVARAKALGAPKRYLRRSAHLIKNLLKL
jgi:hypothetical protein